MKKLYFISILFIVMSFACNSPQKLLEKGQYDAAVSQAVKKLRKKPDSQKDYEALKKAYDLVNQQNMDRINYLRVEGTNTSWEEIYKLYAMLKRRQDLVKTLQPILPAETFTFRMVDYDSEMVQAKMKAAEGLYMEGKKLMENNDKLSYRKANDLFLRTKTYTNDYTDIDELIRDSREKGISRVYVTIANSTKYRLSEAYLEDLILVNTQKLNEDWTLYYNKPTSDVQNFDYTVDVLLKTMTISGENQKESSKLYTKKIEDGYEYILDSKGNVKKDSIGNDLKQKKYKTVSCSVIETLQEKTIDIIGNVDFIDKSTGQSLKNQQISSNYKFENTSRLANGDTRALSSEIAKTVGTKPIAFPNDDEMITKASSSLKQSIQNTIKRNESLFK